MRIVNWCIAGVFGILILVVLLMSAVQCDSATRNRKSGEETPLEEIPFDGRAAMQHLKALCDIGPRPTASEGMKRQQAMIEAHFKKCGGAVEYQRFRFPHPKDGTAVEGANMLVRWKPERKKRILLCAHYDTLPLPLLDPPGSTKPFVGAEDNASGVAVLMQLGTMLEKMLEEKQKTYGVDILMLDAEEFMFEPHGRFFVGSEFFAKEYAKQSAQKRGFSYTCAVLLDMIGQHQLTLPKERFSYEWHDTRRFVNEIWNTARRLGVREFQPSVRESGVLDDHTMLHRYGKIPALDIIDFDYEPWHTHRDTPDQSSPLSLARVGWVVSVWLEEKD